MNRPKSSGRYPAVVLVGGLGCYPVSAQYPGDPYATIAHELAARGIVVVRVEKSGIGDSEGVRCMDADLHSEVAGVSAAMRWLEGRSYVDRSRLFGIGHSVGGTILARVALRQRFRGLIGIAVAGKEYFEYDIDNERRQDLLAGMGAAPLERYMRTHVLCTERFFIERASARSISRRYGDCARHLRFPVSDSYMHQWGDIDPLTDWTAARAGALLIWGSSDFITARGEHVGLVAAMNAARPGTARFVELRGMDHYLRTESSARASYAKPPTAADPLDPRLIPILARFVLEAPRGAAALRSRC